MEHDTSGASCWCGPEVMQPCPECLDTHRDESCWRCGGRGLVPEFDPEAPAVIVHRSTDELLAAAEGRA